MDITPNLKLLLYDRDSNIIDSTSYIVNNIGKVVIPELTPNTQYNQGEFFVSWVVGGTEMNKSPVPAFKTLKYETSETVMVYFNDINKDTLERLQGDSAYQIWLKHGNHGTENDFLQSLKGEKGDSFTYNDFTQEQLENLKGETPTLPDFSNWQKYKLVDDNGNQKLNFNSSNRMTNENLLSTKTGFYFNLEYNDSPSGATGFVYVTENAGSGKKIYYSSYNRNDLYIKSYSKSTGWTEWENLSINYIDTGWLSLPLINGTTQAGRVNLPEYRLVTINDTNLLFIRGAVQNITSRTMTFAKLPTNISQKISSYAEYSKVKINPYMNESAIYNITMTNSGELKITFEPNSTPKTNTPYYIEGTISL